MSSQGQNLLVLPIRTLGGSRHISKANGCDTPTLPSIRRSIMPQEWKIEAVRKFKNQFHWFGLISWRTRSKYSQCWNSVLSNNRRTRIEQQQSSRSAEKTVLLSENIQIKFILDVQLLLGALGSLYIHIQWCEKVMAPILIFYVFYMFVTL